jgi:CheY-like chemotaxis protein
MTEEVMAHIFEPFFTTKFAGRGMGLAAVQGIIRTHGGTISVLSSPGQGSLFTIFLPSLSEPAPHTSASISPKFHSQAAGAAGTVLIIEDEEPLRLAVSKMLRKTGFGVIEASDGREGVDLFRAHEPAIDAVLLDMTLPRLSGREVLRELRQVRPDVNVILATAYNRESTLKALGGPQPWRFIRKPYRLSEMAELLRQACQRSS